MTGRILIPRSEPIIKRCDPAPAWGRDERGRLYVRCVCKLPMKLQHEVPDNGDVSPSLWHDSPECGWHVWATLQDWDGVRLEKSNSVSS